MVAVCERLCSKLSAVELHGIASAVAYSRRSTIQKLSSNMKDRAQTLADEVSALLLPVNFGNLNWCGIIADLQSKRIVFYDSLNGKNFLEALD